MGDRERIRLRIKSIHNRLNKLPRNEWTAKVRTTLTSEVKFLESINIPKTTDAKYRMLRKALIDILNIPIK